DTQENINRMLEIVKTLDVASPVTEDVFVRQIEYATAANIKAALQSIVEESQKQDQADKSSSGPKQSGGPGFGKSSGGSTSGARLLNNTGNNKPAAPETPTPNETMVAGVSDADRGMIRGKVLILDDERSNKLIIITSKANMQFFDKVIETLDVETTPEVQVEVIRLKHAESEDVSSMLNDLIGNSSSSSSTQNNAPANRAQGGNQNLTNQRGGQNRGGQQQSNTQNNAARAKNNQLGELSKDNIKILADKRINGIVVMARKADMKAIKDVIEDMDVKLSQVLIETAIIEVSLGDDIKTGVDWVQRGKYKQTYDTGETDDDGNPIYATRTVRDGFFNHGGENAGYMLGGGGGSGSSALEGLMNVATEVGSNATAAVSAVSPIGSGLNYFLKSDRLNIAAVIQASKSDSHSKYLASPIVMTLDNKEAKIEATDMHYILTGFTMSSTSYTSMAVPNYEQKQIGITITVTPKINPNGTVMLSVEEEYSQLGAKQTIQTSGSAQSQQLMDVNVDTTVTRKMSADISLENRQTVVLGGLVQTYTDEVETGIPLLKDIPWIGKWLFGSTSTSESRKELLIFMTPYVLDDGEMAQAEAIRRKKAMSTPRPFEDNGWSASPLADPVSKREQMRRLEEEWKRQDDERKTRIDLEKAKVERIEKLRAMSEAEQSYWLKLHEEELKKDSAETERQQEELRELVDSIRSKKLDEADRAIEEHRNRNEPNEYQKLQGQTLNAESAEPPASPAVPETLETPEEPVAPAKPSLSDLIRKDEAK
ncbi:MAG: hypothetical protein IJ802_05820, partial [Kiritimatiellae bacterium]|nr:hypothetical protein [Kiritimatiellia bacterium]